MNPVTTVIINPRDRYSGLLECVEQLYRCTPQPFALWIMDLGYPDAVIDPLRQRLAGVADAKIIQVGRVAPMDALRRVQQDVATPSVVLLDNDSRVTEGWLAPLLAVMDDGAAVVSPLILERAGLDEGEDLRNHLYTGELRLVDVAGTDYLVEQKNFRRTPLAQIPRERCETGTFELHCVLFAAATFKAIELPSMVIREHLDIAMQVRARGGHLMVEPASKVTFDNLATRMRLSDMRYFFHRWSRRLTGASSRLFERRWGYRFYSEQSMYNWVFRRKVFLLARWAYLPNGVANRVSAGMKRLFCRDWDPLPDPDAVSRPLYAHGVPTQRVHDLH